MTISTLDGIANALGNNNSRLAINKATYGSMLAGQIGSLWRATGQPAQAAIPGTTPAVPTKATLGALDFTNQTDPVKTYFAYAEVTSSNSGGGIEFHDRVAHMGGLNFNIITAQTITGLDLSTIGLAADRRGAADYSDLQWFLEVYTDGGATASNATINVTYNDASSGNLTLLAVGGTLRAGRMIPLTPLIPTADQGKKIRSINSVTLSAATGAVGSFGFTCCRFVTGKAITLANTPVVFTWQDGFQLIPNDSCLMMMILLSTTSTGAISGSGKLVHG